MSKSLEALERFKQPQMMCDLDWNNRIAIIEKELKDYYVLKKECEEAKWYQEHKALEIIKEMLDSDLTKKLNANSIKIFKDIFNNLPKEKQDLLKEVLL